MKRPALILEEDLSGLDKPVLIVDRIGIIGSTLALKLSKDLLVVLVSATFSKENSNIIHVPYRKKFPEIPDNNYSYTIIFGNDVGTIKSIPSFVKKAKDDNSELILVTYFLNLTDEIASDLAEYEKARVILYGDIFGEGEALVFDNEVNSFLIQAKKFKRIEVLGDGLKKVFPIHFDDLISGILKAVFGTNSKSDLFYLLPKYPITLISLAHLIQKKDPGILIDIKPSGKVREKDFEEKKGGEYLLSDDYPYQTKIKDMNLEEKAADNEIKNIVQKKLYEEKDGTIKKFLYPFFLLTFFLLLPFLSTSLFSFLGFISLNSAKNSIEKGDLKSAQTLVSSSVNLFNLSKYSLKTLVMELKLIGKENSVDSFSKNIESGKEISEAAGFLIKSSALLKNVFTGKSADPNEDVLSSASFVRQSLILFKELEAQNGIPKEFEKKIEDYRHLASIIFNIHDAIPNILDVSGKKKYLILFQNNMELRPGGGFIGSYGILSLNKGKIEDFSIHDVYEADGQLTGHVEPPYPIRRYLPSVHWYLRDSNFDLNFPSVASSAAFFLFQETGQTVDGVIGIDVSFVKNLVSAVGPIYVPEYKETVSGDNFFIVTETHADKDSFPSSTQKKDFLTFLYKAINNKISSEKKLPYTSILKSIGDSVLEKHILFAFSSSQVQKTFTANGLSSSIWDERTQGDSSINDFVGINEANLGVNKANYFIGRSLSYKIQLKENGTILSKLSLSLKNDSTKWPGGDYKNYVRFILPKGAFLNKIIIDGLPQKIVKAVTDSLVYEAKNFTPPAGFEVEKTEEGDKTIYGFLLTVPSGKLKKIDIEYSFPQKISPDAPLVSYNLKLFKQPGTEKYPIDFMFSYPSSLRVLSTSKGLKDQNQKVVLQENLSQDSEIQVDLTQK